MKKHLFSLWMTRSSRGYVLRLAAVSMALGLAAFAQAQSPTKLVNRYKNEALTLVNGTLNTSPSATDTWLVEKTGEAAFVRLKHVASGSYLHVEGGPLQAGAIQPGWWSAQWTLKPVDGFYQIVNRYTNAYVHNEGGPVTAGALGAPGWWSAQWKMDGAPAGQSSTAFHMILASDTQYPWVDKEDLPEGPAKDAASEKYNRDHLKTMNELIAQLGTVKGVVIDGDLTAYGQVEQLAKFKEIYSELKAPLHVGLGNHDYSNNVEAAYENNNSNRMVEYMVEQLKAKNYPNSDYKVRDFYEAPSLVTEISGSLSYSWDEGNVHFVQAQHHPLYEREWSNYVTIGAAKRKTVKITNSLNWLANDLAKARNAGKAIVLMYHDGLEDWSVLHPKGEKNPNSKEGRPVKYRPDFTALSRQFANLLTTYQVSAIVVGHLHGLIGENSYSANTTMYGNTPVFFCGAASYSKYLLAKFEGAKMTIEHVSSADGVMKRSNAKEYPLLMPKPSAPVTAPAQDGYVTFFNQSGYVARYQLFYFVMVNGVKIPYVIPTGDMALGNKKTMTIPGNASEIKITGWTSTGREIFSQSYAATPKVCFKTYATIFSPQWNNNCE